MGGGIGEHVLLGVEGVSSSGDVEPRGVELVDLEAQQIDLASPGPPVTTHGRQLGLEVGDAGARRPQRAEVDPGETVERGRWVAVASRF